MSKGHHIKEQNEFVHSLSGLDENETDLYYYHSDHASALLSTSLGSSSFITDATGITSQHLQYLPYGETFIEQCDSYFDTPYKFSAKEKDEETGYGYFGARYYKDDGSFWISVDPLCDMYPNVSSYMYCMGNPIMLLDPDGKGVDPISSGYSKFKRHIRQTKYGAEIWRQMENSPVNISIIVTNKVIIERTSSGDNVQEGNYEHNVFADGSASGIVNVSLGTYKLEQALFKMYGVSCLADLNPKERVDGLQKLLISGGYEIIDLYGNKIDPLSININTSNNPDAGFIKSPPLKNETKNEYLQRVTGHEGTHPFTAPANIIQHSTQFKLYQEKEAYRREGIIIKQQNNKRIISTRNPDTVIGD